VRTIFRTQHDDEGSGYTWAVYPVGTSDDEIAKDFDFGGHYFGPGRSFSHGCEVTRGRTRVLVKQYSALDI